jgi:hypothetical protein
LTEQNIHILDNSEMVRRYVWEEWSIEKLCNI